MDNLVNVKVRGVQDVIRALQNYNTVILKPNIVDNRNVLTQVMMSERHTKYIIRWNYSLEGATINVPEDCIIEFDGGSIDNGVIVGNNTRLIYSKPIDEICKAERRGTWIYNTSVADEEDITSVEGHLKFKDRPTTDGMGKIILRKNKSFASQVTQPNTIYVIQYDFDLNGENVTIPANCVLQFDGGSLSNGTVVGQNTAIEAGLVKIFSTDVNLSGTWSVDEGFTEWFDYSDATISINKVWQISNVCRFLDRKKYYLDTTLDIPTYKILKGSGEYAKLAYEGQLTGGPATLLANVAPAINLYGGGTIDGLTIGTNIQLQNTEYLIGVYYGDTSKGIKGNPDGTNIINTTIVHSKPTSQGNQRNIDTATGIGIKIMNADVYHLNLINSCIRWFNYAIDSIDNSCIYIFNVINSRVDYCRHIFKGATSGMNAFFFYQGTSTSIEEGTHEPLIEFKRTSTGFFDAVFYDCIGRNTATKFYFDNILSYKPTGDIFITDSIRFGDNIKYILRSYFIKHHDYPDSIFYSERQQYSSNSFGTQRLDKYSNLFRNLKKGVDFAINLSEGVSEISDASNKLFDETLYQDMRKFFVIPNDLAYVEFNFPTFIKRDATKEYSLTTGDFLYNICSVFEFSRNAPRAPKAVLYTIVLHLDSGADFTEKILVYSCRISEEEIITTYQSIIDSDTKIKASNLSEFDTGFIAAYDGLNIPFNTAYIKSVNIKMYGATHSTNRIVLHDIFGLTNVVQTDNILTRSNRWRGAQGFDGLVINRGNQGSARPTGLTASDAGTVWFDKNLSPTRPIWWNGTGWVDATGATV